MTAAERLASIAVSLRGIDGSLVLLREDLVLFLDHAMSQPSGPVEHQHEPPAVPYHEHLSDVYARVVSDGTPYEHDHEAFGVDRHVKWTAHTHPMRKP